MPENVQTTPQVDPSDLTEDQTNAIEAVLEWLEDGSTQEMALGGYAGTGKTTVIKQLLTIHADRIRAAVGPEVATVAFTGKAASVMQAKGLPGQTLHSLMYRVLKVVGGQPEFGLVEDIDCGLVVVDEASMISRILYNDLLVFGVPIFWVGDMGQLEPIGDNPNLMAKPDVTLETIHRQAAQSDIIRLSIGIRQGYAPSQFYPTTDEVVIGDRGAFNSSVLGADQVLCGYNRTRHTTNRRIRSALGYTGILNPGERVICLRNNKDVGVFNGMICTVKDVTSSNETRVVVTVEDEAGNVFEDVHMLRKQFGQAGCGNELMKFGKKMTLWDYGYCITVHKAQGSGWDRVLVMEELHPKWDANRWRYTAVTRAAKQLVYCM